MVHSDESEMSRYGYTVEEASRLTGAHKKALSALHEGRVDPRTRPILERWQERLRECLAQGEKPPPPPNWAPQARQRGRPPPAAPYRPHCNKHGPMPLDRVLTPEQVAEMTSLWEEYKFEMYDEVGERLPDGSRPIIQKRAAEAIYAIGASVVSKMSEIVGAPLAMDHLTVSNTNGVGHPRHADNEVFRLSLRPGEPCLSCGGTRRLRDCSACALPYCGDCGPDHECEPLDDPVEAAQNGATVEWSPGKTRYRNFACSIALTPPESYEGGNVHFWEGLQSTKPSWTARCSQGSGVMFCGCSRSVHSVEGVTSGFRLVLLVWTRPASVPPQGTVQALHRPGTGPAVWLASSEISALAQGRYGAIQTAPEARAAMRALTAVSQSLGPEAVQDICEEVLERLRAESHESWRGGYSQDGKTNRVGDNRDISEEEHA
eukprot:Hpha_TRINITY_DN12543_c0_g1::TRINITY_DN12543_c0_g1_i1::g.50762::m.50762